MATANANISQTLGGKHLVIQKIPVGCFILKLMPYAAEKLIWEKWTDDKVRKIWLNGLNFIFNN